MLTPDKLRNDKRISGYTGVRYAPNPSGGGGAYQANKRVAPGKNGVRTLGPRRVTAEEAAQDHCDYVNSGAAPAATTLKSAGHKSAKRNRPSHPKRVEAYRLLREANADEGDDPSGYVYLISDGTAFKIGKSADDPQNRLKGLQTGNPRLLILLGSKHVPDRAAAEAALHAKFHRYNILGEWFMRNVAILEEFGDTA